MRIHHLQHVPFEGLGSMASYFDERGYQRSSTHLYAEHSLPSQDDFDWLIVMGGPMGVHDVAEHHWLSAEKQFIRAAIEAQKIVLGICLGAQLIADVLGARVTRNPCREIGWFSIDPCDEGRDTLLAPVFFESLDVFHWHGDRFEIPNGAIRLAESAACDNQAFLFSDCVVALQFHLETTLESARELIDQCRGELDDSRYVQTESEMLADDRRFTRIHDTMRVLLERLESLHWRRTLESDTGASRA